MIDVHGLTKEYGSKKAVDDLSFTVRPGVVTGFLGPNGAGKSTALRLILGLDRADAGEARIAGKLYRELENPLRTVGALLDGRAFHRRRSARNHLRWLAAACGAPASRADKLLELVGLADVAGHKVGGFSLGMGQRLGIAAALIGDPRVLLLDEPVNGLDPEGIRWVRTFIRALAEEGRTVLVSSHLLSEMAQTAEDLVVIGRGRLIEQTTVADFIAASRTGEGALVRSVDDAALASALRREGAEIPEGAPGGPGGLEVRGMSAARVGETALRAGIALTELRESEGSLEEAFLARTGEAGEYRTGGRNR